MVPENRIPKTTFVSMADYAIPILNKRHFASGIKVNNARTVYVANEWYGCETASTEKLYWISLAAAADYVRYNMNPSMADPVVIQIAPGFYSPLDDVADQFDPDTRRMLQKHLAQHVNVECAMIMATRRSNDGRRSDTSGTSHRSANAVTRKCFSAAASLLQNAPIVLTDGMYLVGQAMTSTLILYNLEWIIDPVTHPYEHQQVNFEKLFILGNVTYRNTTPSIIAVFNSAQVFYGGNEAALGPGNGTTLLLEGPPKPPSARLTQSFAQMIDSIVYNNAMVMQNGGEFDYYGCILSPWRLWKISSSTPSFDGSTANARYTGVHSLQPHIAVRAKACSTVSSDDLVIHGAFALFTGCTVGSRFGQRTVFHFEQGSVVNISGCTVQDAAVILVGTPSDTIPSFLYLMHSSYNPVSMNQNMKQFPALSPNDENPPPHYNGTNFIPYSRMPSVPVIVQRDAQGNPVMGSNGYPVLYADISVMAAQWVYANIEGDLDNFVGEVLHTYTKLNNVVTLRDTSFIPQVTAIGPVKNYLLPNAGVWPTDPAEYTDPITGEPLWTVDLNIYCEGVATIFL